MTPEQDVPTCPKCGKSDRVEPGGKPQPYNASVEHSLADWFCRRCSGWLSFLASERDAYEGAKLLELLADGPAPLDALAFERGLSADEAAALLLALETRREVRRLPGDRYELAPKGGAGAQRVSAAPLAASHPFDKAEQPPPADQSRRGRKRKGASGE
jgi:hypothetical protein